MTPATGPIVSIVGSRPTANVHTPMRVIVTMNVYLRPMRSPIRPNTTAPNGRTTNPTAKAASHAIRSPSAVPVW